MQGNDKLKHIGHRDLMTRNEPPNAFAKTNDSSPATNQEDTQAAKEEDGLRFRLSPGVDQPQSRPTTNPVSFTELSQNETESILKRLPPMRAVASDTQEFALRDRSLPPPRTGQTINVSFPQPTTDSASETTAAGPLEVLRYAPEGEVPLAPQLSVTFSQPMIALSSQEEAVASVPVTLTPQPPGKWRWVGTKTLLFEPVGRFPMATKYTVTVPAGTRSANGGLLAAGKTWDFTTPPPTVKATYPGKDSKQRRDALMFIEFDQRINPADVLKKLRVSAAGNDLKIRLATVEEIAADGIVRKLTESAGTGRWLSFRAVNPTTNDPALALPANSEINVSIGPGVSSAEGPLTNPKAELFVFRTFGPLSLTKHLCGYNKDCSPSDSFRIEFSNPLDAAAFDGTKLTIEPKIESLKTSINGNTLDINGWIKPRTTYRITVDSSLKDLFGQTLGANTTVRFTVGPAEQELSGSGGNLVVMDPFGPARYSVYSTNHENLKVSVYSVTPEDWPKWIKYRHAEDGETPGKQTPPGRLVVSHTIRVRSTPDETTETVIDLGPALKNDLGHAIVIVEPVPRKANRSRYDKSEILRSWIQRTEIGLDAFVDNTDLIAWATSLRSGAPLKDVEFSLVPYNVASRSGPDGVARLALKPQLPDRPVNLLVARHGNDVAILPEDTDYFTEFGGWYQIDVADKMRWLVFDDRGLYRPGEEVHVKGWIRRIVDSKNGDVGLLNGAATRVSYVVKDQTANELIKGAVAIDSLGGFDLRLKLPATMNLGYSEVELKAEGGDAQLSGDQFDHRFQVAEFRRPEFEVSSKLNREGPLIVGGHADVNVTANYYAGGSLPEAQVAWSVSATPANFTPPNREDFTFGKWIPWWRDIHEGSTFHTETLAGRTDSSGAHRLRIDFDSVKPLRPSTVIAEGRVTDVNRQTWSSKTTMLVHPAALYVGLKSDRTFVETGEPLVVQTIVTDLDGTVVSDREVRMHAVLVDRKYEKGEWKEVETNQQDCFIRSGVDAVRCTFASTEGGEYRITAIIRDDRERLNESELTLWVAGGKLSPNREALAEDFELIPDRKEYRAGDVAGILVQAPFYPAEGVLTLQRSGLVRTERFRLDGPTYTLRVPIEEAWTPNIHLRVDLVGAEEREPPSTRAPKRPASASGELNLSIPPLSRTLKVIASPREKALEPGGETIVNVEASDADGRAVSGSEVAVVVVDEAVLALTEYKLADPIAEFYEEREGGTDDHHSREHLVLAMFPGEGFGTGPGRGGNVGGGDRGEGGGGFGLRSVQHRYAEVLSARYGVITVLGSTDASAGGPGHGEPPIRLRENFNALAVFAPSVRTDANGRAQVQVKLPDNLTRYRVMAVAVAGGRQFGSGESSITARMPLMVRPSAPRFLNFGDQFELPIVVQNQTDDPMTVDLAVRANSALLSVPAAVATGRRLTVAANDRVELRIPAAATTAGTARFQIGVVSGQRWSDAAEISLPIWTPATTEAFATYGEIDQGAITQPVKAPAEVFKQFGGLEIETSSTQLQQLTDAFLYLQNYPYECSEQLGSRILSVAALRDVLMALKAKELPPPPEIEAAVARDIKRLQGMQNENGGFGFWKRGEDSWPYLSVHVAHALARAKQKNFQVPADMLEKSQNYLRSIEVHIPSRYGVDARRALISYALYVRAQLGDRDTTRARKFIADLRLENLSLESIGWLLSVLSGDPDSQTQVAAIRHLLGNRATETAATAHFVSSYGDDDYLLLNSDRRADGVILEALIGDQPNNDLIPKIVRGLLDHRTQGRWANTQENVFILLALDKYFNTYEKVAPDFVARVWLGEAYAGEQQFKGRSVQRQQVNVPMGYLAEKAGENNSAQHLVVSKEGPGRLYYRVAMNYAPVNLNLKSADYGFAVERSYEAVDQAEDVRRDADGTWHIKAGARVRVRLTMAVPSRRYHVALVDHLPAGFESLNPELAVTESIPEDKKQEAVVTYGTRSYGFGWWLWRSVWFDHQNLRDERSEAFTSLLWEGVYNYSYVSRATTPGLFVVPPSKAEEMYHPETFGRSRTDRVRIE